MWGLMNLQRFEGVQGGEMGRLRVDLSSG